MFDPNEKPVHRHLQIASHAPLRVDELERADEETSPASETQDVRSVSYTHLTLPTILRV